MRVCVLCELRQLVRLAEVPDAMCQTSNIKGGRRRNTRRRRRRRRRSEREREREREEKNIHD